MTILAYTYCPDCAAARFGRAFRDDRNPPTDGEGNEVHPVFASDEVGHEGLSCGDCGEVLRAPYCHDCGRELEEGPCPSCAGEDLEEPVTVQGSIWLALKVLDWHGGQGSPSYHVGSCWHALREVPVSLAWQAHRELSRVAGAEDVARIFGDFLEGSGCPEEGGGA